MNAASLRLLAKYKQAPKAGREKPPDAFNRKGKPSPQLWSLGRSLGGAQHPPWRGT